MKFILFLILGLTCNISSLHAQTSVNGNVKNKDKVPLQGCTVWFMQADSLTGGSITDSKGNFTVKGLAPGDYICCVSMIGFKKAEHPFSLEENVNLPQFTLEEDATQLQEVTVTGDKRNIVKSGAGTTSFFLSEKAKKANNIYEALVEIPKLIVNPADRNISLITGENPLILIDGVKRPDYINVLRPELIESVEIIDTPSARYLGDESVTCLLNIHLKRIPTPTYINGNFYTQHAFTTKHGVSGASLEVGNASSSLYLHAQHFYFVDDKSEYTSTVQSGDLLQDFSSEHIYNSNSYYLCLGGDRIFSDKNYAAFAVKYIGNPTDSETNKEGYVGYQSTQKRSETTSYQKSDNKYYLPTAYLYYKHTFNKQQSLEATANYAYSYSSSKGKQNELNDFYQYNNFIDFNNNRHFGKLDLDYTNHIKDEYSLNIGSNTSYSITNIDDLQDLFPVFIYKKWQEYLYIGFDNNRSPSAKFNYTFSLGVDMLFSNADHVNNHYIDILPAAALAYKFNPKHTLSLNYQRFRYSPTTEMLNPCNTSTDSLHIQIGNPYLTPSFQDRVRMSYKLNYKELYFEPYITYSYSSDLIMSTGTVNDNIYTNTYKNFLCSNFLTAGATVSYNLPFGNINMTTYYQKKYQKGMVFNGDTWSTNLSGYFYYKNLSLNFNIGYQTASYGLTQKSEGIPWSNATLSWNLPKNWRCYLMGQNYLYNKMKDKTWVRDNDYTSFSSSHMTDRAPMFLLGVSYSFSNKIQNKWRQKKQFYDTDNELHGIGIK